MNRLSASNLPGAAAFILFILFTAAKTPNDSLSKQLVGEWRNVTLKVVMHSVDGTDSTQTLQADESNWEKKLGMKPIRTHYMAYGTYYSEYRNLKDSIIMRPSGTWSIKGDTLTMNAIKPAPSTYKLKVTITGNIAQFAGLIDFDEDGKSDDEYYGTQRKQ